VSGCSGVQSKWVSARRCITGRPAASLTAFICYRGKYYESEEAMTIAEFKDFDPATLAS
jgi:hypothetical protein